MVQSGNATEPDARRRAVLVRERQLDQQRAHRLPVAVALKANREGPLRVLAARTLLGWPKRCKLAHALLWQYSYKRLELARLLGRHGGFLTCGSKRSMPELSLYSAASMEMFTVLKWTK